MLTSISKIKKMILIGFPKKFTAAKARIMTSPPYFATTFKNSPALPAMSGTILSAHRQDI